MWVLPEPAFSLIQRGGVQLQCFVANNSKEHKRESKRQEDHTLVSHLESFCSNVYYQAPKKYLPFLLGFLWDIEASFFSDREGRKDEHQVKQTGFPFVRGDNNKLLGKELKRLTTNRVGSLGSHMEQDGMKLSNYGSSPVQMAVMDTGPKSPECPKQHQDTASNFIAPAMSDFSSPAPSSFPLPLSPWFGKVIILRISLACLNWRWKTAKVQLNWTLHCVITNAADLSHSPLSQGSAECFN